MAKQIVQGTASRPGDSLEFLAISTDRPILQPRATLLAQLKFLERGVQLQAFPRQTIHHRFFPGELLPGLMQSLSASGGKAVWRAAERAHEFTAARISRYSRQSGRDAFSIRFSGKGSVQAQVGLSIPLTPGRYAELRESASEGYLRKDRYVLNGNLIFQQRLAFEVVPVHPLIDVVQCADTETREDREGSFLPSALSVALVHLNLPEGQEATLSISKIKKALKNRHHDMPWLEGAILMHDHVLERYIRSSVLARTGAARIEREVQRHLSSLW